MRDLLVRTNLVTKDRLSFFSSQWVEHSACLTMGKLTDMKLVAKEGGELGTVHVHRAVILPLCTFLKELEKDVTKEDPVVCLPDIPFELLNAVVRLIYKGFTPVTEVVNASTLRSIMAMLGLIMPADRLLITREKVEDEVQIVGFKNLYGLEIVKSVKKDPLSNHTLEISPCTKPSVSGGKKRRQIQEKQRQRQLRNRSAKKDIASHQARFEVNRSRPEVVTENINEEVLVNTAGCADLPIEVKLECVDDGEVAEFTQLSLNENCENFQSSSKKRKWSRRKETLDFHVLGCDKCEFKCRFRKDLQEHYAKKHTNDAILCRSCGFNASSFNALCAHNKKKHQKSDVACIAGVESVKSNFVGELDKTENNENNDATFDAEANSNEARGQDDRMELIVNQTMNELEKSGNSVSEVDGMTSEHVAQSMEAVECVRAKESAVENSPSAAVLPQFAKENMKKDKGSYDEDIDVNENILIEENLETYSDKLDLQVGVDALNEEGTEGSDSESNHKCKTTDNNGNIVNVDQKAILPNQSGELIGFKCGSLGCSKLVKVQHTEASYSLERLKRHYAQVHSDADEKEFTYINVMKDSSNHRGDNSMKNSKQVKKSRKQTTLGSKQNDDPLKILKEVKDAHKQSKVLAKMRSGIEKEKTCAEKCETLDKQCKKSSTEVSEEDIDKSLKEADDLLKEAGDLLKNE